jgi:uncharacterized protein (TIGR00251 family)
VEVAVRVRPRARRDGLAGVRDGRMLVDVTAPPVDGKANAAVCAVVAAAAGVPRSAVSVVRGAAARDKLLRVDGDEAAVRAALGL